METYQLGWSIPSFPTFHIMPALCVSVCASLLRAGKALMYDYSRMSLGVILLLQLFVFRTVTLSVILGPWAI